MLGTTSLRSSVSAISHMTKPPRAPSIREITEPYALWKYWEALQKTAPMVSEVFAQVLKACPEVTFAVATNEVEVGFGLVDEDRRVVAHAMHSGAQKAWIAAGREVSAADLYGRGPHANILTERQVHDALIASVEEQKLVVLLSEERAGMTGPLPVRLVRHPEAFGGIEQYGCGKRMPPLLPWLSMRDGVIVPWGDAERSMKEARKPWNVIRRAWYRSVLGSMVGGADGASIY